MADIISGKSRFNGDRNAPVKKIININYTHNRSMDGFYEKTKKNKKAEYRKEEKTI